jgi:PAS domain S-box-containing protein
MSRSELHIAQLLTEIESLRHRLAELETTESRLRQTEADLRRQSQRTELINSFLIYLNGCQSEQEVVAPTLETAQSLSGLDCGVLLLDQGGVLTVAVERQFPVNTLAEVNREPRLTRSLDILSGRRRVTSLMEWDAALAGMLEAEGMTHSYAVPLLVGSTPLGILVLATASDREPSRSGLVAVSSVVGMASDVLQRRRAEEQLARSEAQMRAVVEATPDMMVRLDATGHYLDFRINERHPLYPPDESLQGMSVVQILPDDAAQEYLDAIHRVIEFGEMETVEYELETRIGPREFEARIVQLSGSEVLAIVRDVTEERRALRLERVLYEITEATNRTENLRELCASIRTSLNRVLDATNFHIMLRDPASGKLGVLFDTDEHDHDKSFTAEELEEGLGAFVLREGRPMRIPACLLQELGEVGKAQRVGTTCKCFLAAPLFHQGEAFGVVAVQSYLDEDAYSGRDVELLSFVSGQIASAVLRKRAEVERLRLHHAVESIAESIDIIDSEGIIQYVNQGFVRTTGYPREEAIGKTLRLIKSGVHEDAFFIEMWETMKRGEVWSGRVVNRRRDGLLWEEEVTVSPVKDKFGTIVAFVEVRRPMDLQVNMRISSETGSSVVETPRPRRA